MSARQTQPGGLLRAQDRISGLLEELNATVENVDRLTRSGEDAEALKLLDEQRAQMYRLIDLVSRDVAMRGPSKLDMVRRHLMVVAAAALILVSALAVSVGALTHPNPEQQATARIAQAEKLADPAAQLRVIVTVYRDTRSLAPAATAAVDRELVRAAQHAKNKADNGNNQDVAQTAQQIADDIQQGRPPSVPPPQSGDGSPLDNVPNAIPTP